MLERFPGKCDGDSCLTVTTLYFWRSTHHEERRIPMVLRSASLTRPSACLVFIVDVTIQHYLNIPFYDTISGLDYTCTLSRLALSVDPESHLPS